MISTTAWIAKGKAARHPTKYSVDETELERVSKLANVHFQDAKEQLEQAQRVAAGWNEGKAGQDEWEDDGDGSEKESEDDVMKVDDEQATKDEKKDEDVTPMEAKDDLSQYNLDTYDEGESAPMGPFSNIKGLQFYRNNDEDPYITLKDDTLDEDEEKEDLMVQPGDNLLVCAKTEDEVSLLEAYLYTSSDSNLYVHHDLMLPSFPLCLEWLDYKPAGQQSADQNSEAGQVGNYIAVGTMDPEIEIWSMDVVEGLFPDALLGRRDLTQDLNEAKGSGKKKRRQKRERIANPSHHVDAVLGLSWNRVARNLLCSASADTTIKLWDLSLPAETTSESGGRGALRSFDSIHTDKVQSVSWDTSGTAKGTIGQPARLLSGSYDKTLCVFDSRSPNDGVRAGVMADVEAVKWNPWREHNFLASFEDGLIQSFDARVLPNKLTSSKPTQTLFTLSAHDGACTSIDISPHIPGCLATAGSDKIVKLWSIDEDGQVEADPKIESRKKKSISMVTSRDLDAGKIFSASFSPDDPLTLAVAGSKGVLRIWDALSNLGVRKTFGERLRSMPRQIINIDGDEPARGDGVVRLMDEGDESDDDQPAYRGGGGGGGRGGDNDAIMEE
ncbi:hypothetical protein CBS101457_004599 [Exobasidium rhododendri]|nr:hypothetical protein CBS101457_004599 [Exobasidium rhododendri]